MEPDLPPRNARAPARSTSLHSVPDALKTTETLASLLERDLDLDAQVPEEALALRSAFVAYCRGTDWRPQLPPGGATSLSASLSTSGGTLNGGMNGGGLYASPSTQSLGGTQSPTDGTGPRGMTLNHWMRLWADLGLPEGHGGPVPGSVLQTIHSAYRPHNSSRLNYVGFVQACAALSCQMQQNLLGPVGRHGAALQEQQRYRWRVHHLQHQAAQAARNSSRAPQSPAVDEDRLFDSNLDLTPADIAKEIAVISQLQVQLGQQQQQAEGPPPAPASPPPPPPPPPPPAQGGSSWQPRVPPFPPQPPEPTFFIGELSIRSQATALPAGFVGGRANVGVGGGGAVKSPYAAGPVPRGGDGYTSMGGKGGEVGGRRSPQQKAGKASAGGWVRGGGGVADAVASSSSPHNPYLQGLPRSKYYMPQLRTLRNAATGDSTDLRASCNREYSPGMLPRYRDPGSGGQFIDDPDPASSPLDGPTGRGCDRGAIQDQAYPMTSGPQQTTGSPLVGLTAASPPGRRFTGTGGPDTVKLPRVAGARGFEPGGGGGGGGGALTAPQSLAPESLEGGSPSATSRSSVAVNRAASHLRAPGEAAVPAIGPASVGAVGDVAGSGGTASTATTLTRGNGGGGLGLGAAAAVAASGRGGELDGVGQAALASLLGRLERLERAAVSAESRLAYVGSRVRSLEESEAAVFKTPNAQLLNEETVMAIADAAADARVGQFGNELATIIQELDGRQAFLGRQILDQQQRLAEHQRMAAEHQQQMASALAEAMAATRAAGEAVEMAKKDAAAAREKAAAAVQEAEAAKSVAAHYTEVAEAAKKEAEGAAAKAAASLATAQVLSSELEVVRTSPVAEEKVCAIASLAVGEEIGKLLSPAKGQLDEQVRILDEQKILLDEQVAALAVKQQQVFSEMEKVLAAAAAAE
ncbi:hypothetical protein VaNZ11_015803, partial [Volvox africanus]